MIERIRTLIVDDEPLARQLVSRLLGADPAFTVVGECGGGREALAAVSDLAPDLVFLDVEMPDLSGFEVLRRLAPSLAPSQVPYVVFVTAYDQYAVRAFQVHALDYLLKPVEPERFEECIRRVKATLRQRGLSDLAERVLSFATSQASRVAAPGAAPGPRLTLSEQGRLRSLPAADVVWLEASDQYVRVHARQGSYLLSRSLASLEEELPEEDFVRVHRSAVVNLRFVREMRSARFGAHWIVLSTGQRLRLSRGRRVLLPRLLEAARP